ncbi:MAG: HNH endonuclease signature motif containing protein [Chloroflexi bacterium]|nr:HNH endonuclease signature motif containing protein [Chloroflexota bacterium]
MSRVTAGIRQQVYERARRQCEYCQTQQKLVVTMQIDHIIPLAAGGATAMDNLCLSCVSCNSNKRDFQFRIDPATGTHARLFHPRTQRWATHFCWRDDGLCIVGLTATGRATINRLRMNGTAMLESRGEWVAMGKHPPVSRS